MVNHPARSDVFPVPNIASDGRMRRNRQGIKAWSLPRKGRDPENPAPHYDKDGFAVFQNEKERVDFEARSQETSNPVVWDKSGNHF